jgi:hypothetical protein
LAFAGPPGVYHLAVADQAATSHLPPSEIKFQIKASVLDHAGAFVCGNPTTGTSVELEVRDMFGTQVLASSTPG